MAKRATLPTELKRLAVHMVAVSNMCDKAKFPFLSQLLRQEAGNVLGYVNGVKAGLKQRDRERREKARNGWNGKIPHLLLEHARLAGIAPGLVGRKLKKGYNPVHVLAFLMIAQCANIKQPTLYFSAAKGLPDPYWLSLAEERWGAVLGSGGLSAEQQQLMTDLAAKFKADTGKGESPEANRRKALREAGG